MDGLLSPPRNTAASSRKCAQTCSDNFKCSAWSWCSDPAGCVYPSVPTTAQQNLVLLTLSQGAPTPQGLSGRSFLPDVASSPLNPQLASFPAPLGVRGLATFPGGYFEPPRGFYGPPGGYIPEPAPGNGSSAPGAPVYGPSGAPMPSNGPQPQPPAMVGFTHV